jgi:hypothetical protein
VAAAAVAAAAAAKGNDRSPLQKMPTERGTSPRELRLELRQIEAPLANGGRGHSVALMARGVGVDDALTPCGTTARLEHVGKRIPSACRIKHRFQRATIPPQHANPEWT